MKRNPIEQSIACCGLVSGLCRPDGGRNCKSKTIVANGCPRRGAINMNAVPQKALTAAGNATAAACHKIKSTAIEKYGIIPMEADLV